MNRSRKIIEVLEGFKLGSLGAGVKIKPVEEPIKSKKPIPVAKQTDPQDTGYKTTRNRWYNPDSPDNNWYEFAMTWTEVNSATNDRIKFCMLLYVAGNNCIINISGGPDLKIEKDSLSFATHEQFYLNYELDDNNLDTANTVFNDIWKEIKWEGSFGLALVKGLLGGRWQSGGRGVTKLIDYFEKTTGVAKLPHYIKP